MRAWTITCAIAVLLLIPLGIEYRFAHPTVPSGVQRSECLTPHPEGETHNDAFTRLGGRLTRYPNAQWIADGYTVRGIAQGRDLNKYEKLVLKASYLHDFPEEMGQARRFLWKHWQSHKPAYLVLTMSSVDHTETSHYLRNLTTVGVGAYIVGSLTVANSSISLLSIPWSG